MFGLGGTIFFLTWPKTHMIPFWSQNRDVQWEKPKSGLKNDLNPIVKELENMCILIKCWGIGITWNPACARSKTISRPARVFVDALALTTRLWLVFVCKHFKYMCKHLQICMKMMTHTSVRAQPHTFIRRTFGTHSYRQIRSQSDNLARVYTHACTHTATYHHQGGGGQPPTDMYYDYTYFGWVSVMLTTWILSTF